MNRNHCHFWDCTQVLHFRLFCWLWVLLHFFLGMLAHSSRYKSSELNSPIPVYFSSLIPEMLMFTLPISCLTTSNLPWFMGLTFQISMQYSLHHWTLPDTLTTGHCFFFGSTFSFLLVLFLLSSPVACFVPTDLGGSSFRVISFCLFLLFMGFSRQECWSGLPFFSPVDHILSEN